MAEVNRMAVRINILEFVQFGIRRYGLRTSWTSYVVDFVRRGLRTSWTSNVVDFERRGLRTSWTSYVVDFVRPVICPLDVHQLVGYSQSRFYNKNKESLTIGHYSRWKSLPSPIPVDTN